MVTHKERVKAPLFTPPNRYHSTGVLAASPHSSLSILPLAVSVLATSIITLFPEHNKYVPTLGPLHSVSTAGNTLPQIPIWLTPG